MSVTGRDHRILLLRNTFANAGDEAMLSCELGRLRERFPDAEITLLTDAPGDAARRHDVEARPSDTVLSHPIGTGVAHAVRDALTESDGSSALVRTAKQLLIDPAARAYLRWSCRRFVRSARRIGGGRRPRLLPDHHRDLLTTLRNADVVFGGGSLLPSLPDLFNPRKALYRAAELLDVPVILHGQSILPDARAGSVLRRVSRIVLRDDSLSRRNAIALGVSPGRLLAGTDPATGLEPSAWRDVRTRIDGPEPSPEPGSFVAVNVRDWKERDLGAGIRAVGEALQRFTETHGTGRLPIVLFGMQTYHDDDDRRALDALADHLGPETRPQRLGAGSGPRDIKGLIGHAHLVVSCRYHGALFALEQGIPAIALSIGPEYDIKLGGLYRRFGVEEYLGSLVEPDARWLDERLKRIDGEREAISHRLRGRAAALAGLRDVGYDAVEAVLENGAGSA